MRPWRLRPLTLRLAERVVIGLAPDIIIEYKWWCRGLLRIPRWRRKAVLEAVAYIDQQFKSDKPKSGVRVKEDDTVPASRSDIMEAACNAALRLGGTPEEWRDALWADVRYMISYREWEDKIQAAAADKKKPSPGDSPKRIG